MAPLETIEYKGHTITVYQDDDAESPAEWGNFEVKQWTEVVDQDGELPDDFKQKLMDGRAFWVDKYEHSQVRYSLNNDASAIDWDTSGKWGVIILTDEYSKGVLYEERQEIARGDLNVYTQWANGEVYTIWVTHPEHEGGDSDTLSGMYGDDFGFQPVIDEAKSMIDAELSGPYHHDFITAPKASKLHN